MLAYRAVRGREQQIATAFLFHHHARYALGDDAKTLGCRPWLDVLHTSLFTGTTGSDWLRARLVEHRNLNDVVRDSAQRFSATRPSGN